MYKAKKRKTLLKNVNLSPILISLQEGSELSGLSYEKIRLGVKNGKYPYVKNGPKYLLHYEEFRRVLLEEAIQNYKNAACRVQNQIH